MSDAHAATTSEVKELFTNAEVREFEAADAEAGRAICKMLCILFIYTVIAMSITALWTAVVSNN